MEHIHKIEEISGTESQKIVKTIRGITVENTINHPQNNENVVKIASDEWVLKLLEEKDKRLEEKDEVILEKNRRIIELERYIKVLESNPITI